MDDLFCLSEYNIFIFDYFDLGSKGYKIRDGFLCKGDVIVQSEFRPYSSIPDFPEFSSFKFKTDISYDYIPEEYLIFTQNIEFTSKVDLVNSAVRFNKTNRKIVKRMESSYTLHECEDVSTVYNLLVANRAKLGAKLSLSENYFEKFKKRFPENIKMFLLKDNNDRCCAATLILQRSKFEVYVYAWGHIPNSENGVMSVMAHKLFHRLADANIQIVDLGMNYDSERKTKHSLVAFKRGIGAKILPVLTIVNKHD